MEKKRAKKVIKGYRLEKKLGSGSFGVVFKVVRLSDGWCLHVRKMLVSNTLNQSRVAKELTDVHTNCFRPSLCYETNQSSIHVQKGN